MNEDFANGPRVELLQTSGGPYPTPRYGVVVERTEEGACKVREDLILPVNLWSKSRLRFLDGTEPADTQKPDHRAPRTSTWIGQVTLGGVPHDIARVHDGGVVDHDGIPMDISAQIDFDRKSIRFAKGHPAQELRSVLQAVLSGVIYNGDIHNITKPDGTPREGAVRQLAIGLAEVLESIGISIDSFAGHGVKK